MQMLRAQHLQQQQQSVDVIANRFQMQSINEQQLTMQSQAGVSVGQFPGYQPSQGYPRRTLAADPYAQSYNALPAGMAHSRSFEMLQPQRSSPSISQIRTYLPSTHSQQAYMATDSSVNQV